MNFETILYDTANMVASITLNRPDTLNAFNQKMIAETVDAFKRAENDANVRCIVLTGSGKAFSSGQDLKDVQRKDRDFSIGEHVRRHYNVLISTMVKVEKPVIAAVNGVAAGAGCSVALAADLRIASHKASFIQAFSRVGLIPDSGSTWMLPRLIGYARAFEMAVTAERISAEKALEWGLANVVVPNEQLSEVVAAWARSLAEGPSLAFGLTKRAMREGSGLSLADALKYESYLQEIAGRSHDFQEGVQAFIEKRDPIFNGE